jgi:hypothetical protein
VKWTGEETDSEYDPATNTARITNPDARPIYAVTFLPFSFAGKVKVTIDSLQGASNVTLIPIDINNQTTNFVEPDERSVVVVPSRTTTVEVSAQTMEIAIQVSVERQVSVGPITFTSIPNSKLDTF